VRAVCVCQLARSPSTLPTTTTTPQGWLVLTLALPIAIFYRRTHYRLFQYTHHAIWFYFFAALVHAWSHWYYVAGGLALYAFDKLARAVQSSRQARVVSMVTADGITRLEVEAAVFAGSGGHYAGQYAFVNVPEVSALEWHPFTISSPPHAAQGVAGRAVVTFHIKDMGPGKWTHRLAQLAQEAAAAGCAVDVPVSIDGPYGRTGHYYERETVVLLAGGIGITPMVAVAADLHARAASPEQFGPAGHVRQLHLVWVVRERALVAHFADALAALVAPAAGSGLTVHLHLHCTDKGTGSSASEPGTARLLEAGCVHVTALSDMHSRIVHGRPHLERLFASIATSSSAATGSASSRVSVLVCGPEALILQASDLSFAHGFDFHSEVFHF